MAQMVTITEAARALGLNHSTVSRQVQRLGLLRRGERRFDLETYRQVRERALNPLMARNRPAADSEAAPPPQSDEPAPAPPPAATNGHGAGLQSAAADEKRVKTELAQLQLEEKKGLVVARAEVEAEAFDAGRRLRDGLLALAREVADEIAAMSEPREVRRHLERRMRARWEQIADELDGRTDDTGE